MYEYARLTRLKHAHTQRARTHARTHAYTHTERERERERERESTSVRRQQRAQTENQCLKPQTPTRTPQTRKRCTPHTPYGVCRKSTCKNKKG